MACKLPGSVRDTKVRSNSAAAAGAFWWLPLSDSHTATNCKLRIEIARTVQRRSNMLWPRKLKTEQYGGTMRPHSLMIALALAIGLAMPAAAQQSMHRYATLFKYSDEAMKAMTEHPQDRQAAAAKLAEEFGGKLESAYWFSTGSEYDGIVIWQLPDDVTSVALGMMTRASENFTDIRNVSVLTSQEFTAAMKKVKGTKSSSTDN
jgi:uncharacterized protein with GYD domain